MDPRRKSFSFFKAKNVGKMAAIKLICSFAADKKPSALKFEEKNLQFRVRGEVILFALMLLKRLVKSIFVF